ncbi:hypothetical protein F2Q70_00013015 [Brassica cretica]|uniref:Uncharacterized protein n=1 Tax=Brassica cretica TaxID=69181 RepID=A0A8S9LSN7_BRACR|nr:hypothetical protein F2Q70_00013015 [Brassica cretica]
MNFPKGFWWFCYACFTLSKRKVALKRKWRATSCYRSGKVTLRGRAQRVHGVAPVGSLPCTTRPMITLITSFELQTHPIPKNSMWKKDNQPPMAYKSAATSARRSGRSLWVLGATSGSRCGTSLPACSSCLKSTQTRATSGCRYADLALEMERLRVVALGGRSGSIFALQNDEMASDLVRSLW